MVIELRLLRYFVKSVALALVAATFLRQTKPKSGVDRQPWR